MTNHTSKIQPAHTPALLDTDTGVTESIERTTTLRYLPIYQECGYVFEKGELECNPEVPGHLHPRTCPRCGSWIESIALDNAVRFMESIKHGLDIANKDQGV